MAAVRVSMVATVASVAAVSVSMAAKVAVERA
jgi:hypothetical protein